MNSIITMSFGNTSIIKSIQRKHPNIKLDIFSNGNNQYQIVDFNGNPGIFTNPITFQVLAKHNFNNNFNFINYSYFNLNKDEKNIFDAKISEIRNSLNNTPMKGIMLLQETNERQRLVLVTTWESYLDFNNWIKGNDLISLAELSLNYKRMV